jgi:hypothetical protein
MAPLDKVLTEGNTPSLPRFIGKWGGFFNAGQDLIARLSFCSRNNKARETLNKSTFCGEPAQLCDAGCWKIKDLA